MRICIICQGIISRHDGLPVHLPTANCCPLDELALWEMNWMDRINKEDRDEENENVMSGSEGSAF